MPLLLHLHEIAKLKRLDLEAAVLELANCAYLGDHTAIARVLGRYKLYIDTRDRGFGSHILLDGYWEIWLTQFCARNVRRGMTAIDVGANFGYYSVLLADLVGETGKLLAIEPNPHAADFLKRSLDLNGFTAHSQVIEKVLGGAESASARLFVYEHEPKNARVASANFNAENARRQGGYLVEIPSITMDSLCAPLERIDFIKIDAEGSEEDIFSAIGETIERHRPMMVIEFNAARSVNTAQFIERLANIYGVIRHLDFEGFAQPISAPELLTQNYGQDWLLVLSEKEPA
ncbi:MULTISPECIES: FkbM family methyltransferase [unclassified Phyllobacterium]|uniref:FkbM family methyltransferase n=1 Tax=unclassified Phyllobacterium TaxID=2638441 RepID=UPI0030130A2A